MQPRTWRSWHRWVGWLAALFLMWIAGTGFCLAGTEFFGEAEAERERLRDTTSAVTTAAAATEFSGPVERAIAAANRLAPGAPIDRVEVRYKADPARVVVYLGRPGGGEDRSLVFAAATGELIEQADYTDKSFLHRLHSMEAFGDGGLGVGMASALALLFVTISGVVIYLQMRRPGSRGWRRLFW